jgi:hypothetical protein
VDPTVDTFLRTLARGPAFLMLGQGHLNQGTRGDALLAEIARKWGLAEAEDYMSLLGVEKDASPEATLAWLDERCRRIAPPESFEAVADFAWSGIVTSAIDTVITAALRRPWRDLQPVFDERHSPADPRNRARLHCTFLFGNVNRTDPRERVPLSRFELLKRKQVAVALARRLPEAMTPLGVLAIEGYHGERDWFPPELLAPVLSELNPGQVHLFSCGDSLRSDPLIDELVAMGVVIPHEDSLAMTLTEASAAGLLKLGPTEAGGDVHTISLESTVARIPNELWNRMRPTAQVLDDAALAPAPRLSRDATYREFRAFLGSGDSRPRWESYERGFAFPRPFERSLAVAVERALRAPGFQEHPIVLHGPTGSGKTVALGALARAIRTQGEYPVLYVERRAQPPSYGDIDVFCEWVEREGATATLVAWDGMLSPGDYGDALRYLGSRGRNVVVVGSSYRLPEEDARGTNFVHAPAQLASDERSQFLAFLRQFEPGLDELVKRRHSVSDETFLVALYRLLPPVRGVVRAGVAREVRHAERTMAELAERVEPEYEAPNALARALREAGVIDSRLSDVVAREVGTELVDDFQRLTGLVMVPGRFGLRVPLELLLRALGHEGFSRFIDLLNGVDIFRWYEDAAGNIEIGSRSRLEAALIAQSRTGDAETEMGFVRALLLELKAEAGSWSGGREVAFAVQLLQAVGPGGDNALLFGPHFVGLANTLLELRTERGLANPRLMLQEANLRREAAVYASRGGTPDFDLIARQLDMAEGAVRDALDLVPNEPRSRGLRSNLLVELASTMGTRSTQLLEQDGAPRAEAAALVASLREVVGQARRDDPTSYHPVDVLAWATRNAIHRGLFEGPDKIEALSDVLGAFQSTELEELEPKQVAQFHSRRYEIATLVDDADLADESARALKERGSGAALFLQALAKSGLARSASGSRDLDASNVQAAVELLESESELLWRDSRCLDLYLDLWWLDRTGEELFRGERLSPGLDADGWQHLLTTVAALSDAESSRRPTLLAFLRGLAMFNLGRLGEALAVFKEVERQSTAVRSRRRVIRTYLASTSSGAPRAYHGTIAWLDPTGRKGDLFVEELRTEIPFIAHDFRLDDARRGLDIGEFHIAFNFLGPIADPPIFSGGR